MHAVIETDAYIGTAESAGVSQDERDAIVTMLAANPAAGELIQGTGGARKVRVAAPGRGKSGGYRVVTYYGTDDVPLFLLDLYAKGAKATLTKAEKNALRAILGDLADDYRASVKARVTKLPRRTP